MIILNYHELTDDNPSNAWSLTSSQFEAHVALFQDRAITPERFLGQCHAPEARTDDSVLLTLDDGLLSDYTHVFAKYVIPGRLPPFMSFLPVDAIGTPGRMTWDMVRELHEADIVVGSHGMSHRDLTTLPDWELEYELTASRATIEDRLGAAVTLLAFPFGRFSRRVWSTALETGYTHLFTIQLGFHPGFESFLFSRLCVTNTMGPSYMKRHLKDPNVHRGLGWRVSTALGVYRPLMRLRHRLELAPSA